MDGLAKEIMSEEDTIKQIGVLGKALKKRDKDDLVFIHKNYYHRIKSYISGSVYSSQDVEDLTQEVFVELSKKSSSNKEYTNPEAYLLGICSNIINQYARNKKKTVKAIPITAINETDTNKSEQKDSFERILLSERKQVIEEVVKKLPPKARQAIKLRFINNLKPKEAAKKAGCSVNVFKERLKLGLKIIRSRTTYKKEFLSEK